MPELTLLLLLAIRCQAPFRDREVVADDSAIALSLTTIGLTNVYFFQAGTRSRPSH